MSAQCHRVVFLACGSYNPPTILHLRLFELARDFYRKEFPDCTVLGGVISPAHDSYKKKGLISSVHRLEMARRAVSCNPWIRVSDWETMQEGWTRTRVVLDTYTRLAKEGHHLDWLPHLGTEEQGPIRFKLLCGADLLESFSTPGLWIQEDIEKIVSEHGMVVISREGSNPEEFIQQNEILRSNKQNIHIVTEWITNDVSSTRVRGAVGLGFSIKYLVPDPVIQYIQDHKLYTAS